MSGAASLAQIDWDGAGARADRADPFLAVAFHSLAALFAGDYQDGLRMLRRARQAEPLNPLHDLRSALFAARFGDLSGANAALQRLQRHELPAPIIAYLRALFALRGGRADQARAIAGTIETAHPDFQLAKFLRAEAQIVMAINASKLERVLRALPTGERWAPCWTDLLVKLVLLHPKDGPALAARYEKRIGDDAPLRAAFDKAIAWSGASIEQLGEALGAERPGSRGEALLLETLADKLAALADDATAPRDQGVRLLAAIRARHPDRAGLRRIMHSFHTRHAAAAAAEGRYGEALRFTERSLAELPYDLVYYQNRAALFTLMREADAYHEAWQALNLHQYRLLLLGFAGPVLEQTIKAHRVFAQQSRGGGDALSGGLFRLVQPQEGPSYLRLNQDAIAGDPDLLRQWYHHKRAELAFRHLALDEEGVSTLLAPADRDEAEARAAALDALGQSLAVLVPEEGAELADALGRRWSAAADAVATRYRIAPSAAEEGAAEEAASDPASEAEPEAVGDLREEHVAVLADLCLILWIWQPQHEHLWIAEELLSWLPRQRAFAGIDTLARMEKAQGHALSYPLRMLAGEARRVGGGDRPLAELADAHLGEVADDAAAELLRSMAISAYYGSPGVNRDRAALAMELIDRARALRPADAMTELTAAELLSLGEYYDEARRSLDRFRRLVRSDDQRTMDRADKLEEALADHRQKGEKGHDFKQGAQDGAIAATDARHIVELIAEIDESPTAWRLYAALVKELVLADRMDEAVEWADRCVSRCLGRSEQIGARGLAMEARGLKGMMAESPRAAKLYAVGAYEPARRALEGLATAGAPFDVSRHYLLGRCQLETGMPDAARASFRAAYDLCGESIYRPVLRRLTEDIDQAYLAVARGTIDERIKAGDFDEAIAESCRVIARLRKPEAWLVDMARMFCSAAMGRLRGEAAATVPAVTLAVPWQGELAQALHGADDVARAIALAELAQRLDPAVAPRAGQVVDRAVALRRQLATAAALDRAGELLAGHRFDETLAGIDALDPAIAAEPRVRRLRILALLGAHRFREADEAVAGFGEVNSADVRQFLANYPSFAFRQRIALAHRLLREGKAADALAVLQDLAAPGPAEEPELAYCQAFAATLEAYDRRRRGDREGARRRFEDALMLLEPHVRQPATPPHLAELYERLEMEADQHVG
jgi:hypothetical protein